MHPRKPVWKTSSFLVYSGGLTVLFAALAALGYLSTQYGKGALTGWALLILVVLRLTAESLRFRGRWVAAGIFAFISIIAWGALIGIAWSWFGWLGSWHNAFGGWSLAHLSLEFLVLVAALGDQLRWRFPFIALISTVVGWFFVTDFVSNGGTWTYVVTLVVGLCYLVAGSVSRGPHSFWLHLVGGLLISVPLLHWWHTTTLDWALVSAVAFIYVAIAYGTGRSSWAVLATIGFFGVTIHFLVGSPTQLAGGLFGVGGGGGGCTTNGLSKVCTHTSSVSGWSPALAFGLLGFWLVLLGLAGRARRTPAPVVLPPA